MNEAAEQAFEDWTALWNGDTALAEKIMAPEFRLRYAQPGAEVFDDVRHPHQLADVIAKWHAARPGLRFQPEGERIPELVMGDGGPTGKVASPYLATYTAHDGEERAISGIDILRLENGLITEVWSVSGGPTGRRFYND
jgi:hypothetical protein